jgi:predicted glycoside hydrolase/deacetylase ChbG (UPF0249 family)
MREKLLIVNADDYGLCPEISLGILKAHRQGMATATSVVTVGGFFAEGLPALKASGIDVGIHLTLVGQERPLTGPIRGLVDEAGFFWKDYARVIPRILAGQYDPAGLEKELFAQTALLRDAGLAISHIDAHQHLHLLPPVAGLVIKLARFFNIGWIRLPQAHRPSLKALGLNFLSRRLAKRLARHHLRGTDHSLGFDDSGAVDEKTLLALLGSLQPGITELIMHPGYDASKHYDWGFAWQDELDALVAEETRHLLAKLQIRLTDYGRLA